MSSEVENTRIVEQSKPLLWKLVVGGVVIAGVCLWIASVLDLERVWLTLQNVDYLFALLSIPPVIASHWLRAVRWKVMLSSDPQLQAVSLLDLFSGVMIGYTANNIIPRSGELLRPLVVARRHNVSPWLLVASVIAERLIDVIQLLAFIGVGLLLLPEIMHTALPTWMLEQSVQVLALILLITLGAIVVVGISQLGEKLLVGILRRIRYSLSKRIELAFDAFRRGFRVIHSVRQGVIVLVQSLGIWLLYALPLWIVLQVVPMTSMVSTWSLWDACVILLVVAVGTTIAPTPGAIGVVHALVAEAMHRLYSIRIEEAFVFITVAHALNYISVMVVGAIFAAREGMTLTLMVHPARVSETALTSIEKTNA